jgi:hypothetical protein
MVRMRSATDVARAARSWPVRQAAALLTVVAVAASGGTVAAAALRSADVDRVLLLGSVNQVRAMYAKVKAPDRALLVTAPDGLRGLSMVDPALDPNATRVRQAIEDFLRRHAAE